MPKSFLRKSLAGFRPYIPGQQPPDDEDWVKLNTNESPWPPSERVLAAIREAVLPVPLSAPLALDLENVSRDRPDLLLCHRFLSIPCPRILA